MLRNAIIGAVITAYGQVTMYP